METFDYDMAVESFGQSLSPGNEQRDYWGSKAADEEGSRNLLGIKNPVIDELIEELIKAPDRASLVAHTRALDRVLQYGYYVIPHFHYRRVARRLLGQVPPPADRRRNTASASIRWWVDPKAEQTIEAKKGEVQEGRGEIGRPSSTRVGSADTQPGQPSRIGRRPLSLPMLSRYPSARVPR